MSKSVSEDFLKGLLSAYAKHKPDLDKIFQDTNTGEKRDFSDFNIIFLLLTTAELPPNASNYLYKYARTIKGHNATIEIVNIGNSSRKDKIIRATQEDNEEHEYTGVAIVSLIYYIILSFALLLNAIVYASNVLDGSQVQGISLVILLCFNVASVFSMFANFLKTIGVSPSYMFDGFFTRMLRLYARPLILFGYMATLIVYFTLVLISQTLPIDAPHYNFLWIPLAVVTCFNGVWQFVQFIQKFRSLTKKLSQKPNISNDNLFSSHSSAKTRTTGRARPRHGESPSQPDSDDAGSESDSSSEDTSNHPDQ